MYPTEVIIDYSVLEENFRALQALSPEDKLAPVIKSDGYGHGLVPTAKAFLAGGAQRLAVFRVEEALALRDAGIDCPVWVLLGALPGGELELAFGRGFTLACYCMEQLQELLDKVKATGILQPFHLAVDTGMGRLGFLPEKLPEILEYLAKNDGMACMKGICSHVAKASAPTHPVTLKQVGRFRKALTLLPASCDESHLCASDAWMNHLLPEVHVARPGICLYVPLTLPGSDKPLTRGAMTVRTKLVSLKAMPAGSTISYNCLRTLERDSLVAVAPIGYEDGFSRSLTNKGYALVRGQRAPILGTICMSMTMLDVTDISGVAMGDEAVFLGRQGNEEITIQQLTQRSGVCVEHELLCNFGKHR